MKPRIRLWRGLWHCFEPKVMGCKPMGEGENPEQAYRDWWAKVRRMWLEVA